MELWQMRDLVQAAMICLEAIPYEAYGPADPHILEGYQVLDDAFTILERAATEAENLAAEAAADDVAGDRSSG